MFDLSNKVAVVTGASRGIGKSIAKAYARSSAHVVCVSRTEKALTAVVEEIKKENGSASVSACDVSDPETFNNLIKDAALAHGSVDILINNAGITRDRLIMRMSEDDWNMVIDTNLKLSLIHI